MNERIKKGLIGIFSLIIVIFIIMMCSMNKSESIALEKENTMNDVVVNETDSFEEINQKYFNIEFDLDSETVIADGVETKITDFLNITEDNEILSSTNKLYEYLSDNLIGKVQIENNTIKVENPYSTNTIIVQTSNIEEVEEDENVQSIVAITDNIYCVHYENAVNTKSGYDELKANEQIDNVSTDVKVTVFNDYTENFVETEADLLSVSEENVVWGRSTTGMNLYTSKLNYLDTSTTIKVAVLDSGIRTSHEVFANEETADRIDITYSHNYVSDDTDITDDNEHGTMVAGVIAECTSNNVKIVPVKVIAEDGTGDFSDLLEAISYIAEYVDVINLSLGTSEDNINAESRSLYEEVLKSVYDDGTLIVCASGNGGDDSIGDDDVSYPASSDYTIAVSALKTDGTTIASFSNYGSTIDFAAPGQGLIVPYYTGDSVYRSGSGTSLAAPFITAAIALVKSENNTYTTDEILKVLKENCDDLGDSGWDVYYGYGGINFKSSMFATPVIASVTTSGGSTLAYALCSNELVSYYWGTTSDEPEDTDWVSFEESSNIIELTLEISTEGTYYIWIKDIEGNVVCKEFTILAQEMENTQTLEDGYYEIYTALASNKVLDISGASTSNGANVQIWSQVDVKQQKFKVTYNGDGYYTITNVLSRKVLDVQNGSGTSGTNVWQYESNNSKAQKWILKDCGDGYYYIISALNEDLYLDVANASTVNGTNVQIFEGDESKSQKFKFVETDTIMAEQTIADGYYAISTALDSNKVLDVSAASKDNGANIQIWYNVEQKQQIFKVTYDGDGYYTITNALSGKMLDVQGGVGTSGTNVWQYESNGTNAQKWIISESSDGYYNIVSALNDLYLDVANASTSNGANVWVYDGNGSKAQKFKFDETDAIMPLQTIADGYYIINTALDSNKVLDISAASKDNGANIQIWYNVGQKQQIFKVTYNGDGYYTIQNALTKKVLDVQGGAATSGTNVWQYESNGTDAQKWMIGQSRDGYYYIVSALNDLYLDVANASTSNGTNIWVYDGNGSKAQKFQFTASTAIIGEKTIEDGIYKISIYSDTSKVLDISGGSTSSGANLQIWEYTGESQQKFKITYDGYGYYTITNVKSGKVLDVENANAANCTNVQQFDSNGTDAQKWMIIDAGNGNYNIVSALQDYYLDLSNGSTGNGTNIQIFVGHDDPAQLFRFDSVTVLEVEEGTYGSSGLQVKGDSRGSSLKYYKIGSGSNVFFATFAVHGWEDSWSYDGQELTKIAESFKNKLIELQDESLANKWTIYIFPSVNPDGEYYGYTNNGPGRTSLYSASSSHQGIDINRTWSTGWTKYTSARNYNGTSSFQAYEAQYLKNFLLNHRATSGQTVLVDLHGWLNETLGDDGIGSYYRSQFGMSKHISSYGNGYLINWARSNLGYNGVTARSCLVEMPEVSSSSQVTSQGFANKYINATLNMLRLII